MMQWNRRSAGMLMTRHFVRRMQQPLAPEQIDAAIAEMNAEMSDLFGSVSGADAQMAPPLARTHSRPVAQSTPSDWLAATTLALQNHVHLCGGELTRLGTSDHETRRGERLAATIAECARALTALQAVELEDRPRP